MMVANLNLPEDCAALGPARNAAAAALMMAVLSPVMADLGAVGVEKEDERLVTWQQLARLASQSN